MAHQSKFLSVNLNKSYGEPSAPTTVIGNGRPRSAGGGGGMVVLSRPRSSSGITTHKKAPRLAVPPPVNLPSLRKEHELHDPASSKPSAGHGGSGMGAGHGSSMGWTKPGSPLPGLRDKDGSASVLASGNQRVVGGDSRLHGFMEKAVIFRGEDFPSLRTSSFSLNQRQRSISDNSEAVAGKPDLHSMIDMRPQLRSSPPSKGNAHVSERGSNQVLDSLEQSRKGDENMSGPLPLLRLRHTSDWDDDERDRNNLFTGRDRHDGRLEQNGEAYGSLTRKSMVGDQFGREFTGSSMKDGDLSFWRATVQVNKDSSPLHVSQNGGDQTGLRTSGLNSATGTESSFEQLHYGDRRGFSSRTKTVNSKVAEASMDRVEVSKSWNKGRVFSYSMTSDVQVPSGIKATSIDAGMTSGREKLISSVRKQHAEDGIWESRDPLSGNHAQDLNSKVFRKKKEEVMKSDFYDPVRASFEAELERVQRIQEEERQRIMEEKVKAIELARRESEERERMALEEEERRRQVEKEVREAAWRAEQERIAAARRAEEQRIAKEEEKRRFLMEEERRIEAARRKLLELNAKIAKREAEANLKQDRLKDGDTSIVSDATEWEETERIVEPITISTSSNSSVMNRLSEVSSRSYFLRNGKYSSNQQAKLGNKWSSNNSNYHFQDQDGDYHRARHDAFGSKKGFPRKDLHSNFGSTPFRSSFKSLNSDDPDQRGQPFNCSSDGDQFNGRSDIDASFENNSKPGGIDWSHSDSFPEGSIQNSEVDDFSSFGRAHHSLKQPHVLPPPSVSSSMRRSSFEAGYKSHNLPFPANAKADRDEIHVREEGMWMECAGYQQRIEETAVSDSVEVSAGSVLEKEEKSSLLYGSQTPLTVSTPPTSPTQCSHDEFDECGGSPALMAYSEGEHATFSEGKNMMSVLEDGHMDSKLIIDSLEEDDEWTVEYSEVGEEQEVHDECHVSFQGDNEVHGVAAGVLPILTKLQEMDLGGGKPTGESDQAGCGLDPAIQLGTSSYAELKKCSEDGEPISAIQESSVDSMPEFDDHRVDSLHSDDAFHDKTTMVSSEIADKSDNALQELIIDSVKSQMLPIDSTDADYSAEDPLVSASSFSMPSTPLVSSMPASGPIGSDQSEIPVKLQFGLFSGPPLIPSPIPAIQIGSIQMPLPLHSQFDPYSQMHPPHPPLFQFGHIRYTPPISQSYYPVYSQTISSVHSTLVPESSKKNDESTLNIEISSGYSSTKNLGNRISTHSADKYPGSSPELIKSSEIVDCKHINASFNVPQNELVMSHGQMTETAFNEEKVLGSLSSQAVFSGVPSSRNIRSMVNNRRSRGRQHAEQSSMGRKFAGRLKATGTVHEIRGKRFAYVKDVSASSTRTINPPAHLDQFHRRIRRHIRRTEYRVRGNDGTRQSQIKVTLNQERYCEKPLSNDGLMGIPLRAMGKKGPVLSDSMKPMNEGVATYVQSVNAGSIMSKNIRRETMPRSSMPSVNVHGSEDGLSSNRVLEEDDAPLQSGFIRIFNQPGIEASSDADGFVEVKSKRKVLNDKRGQREREANSKNKDVKVIRRHCDIPPNNVVPKSDNVTAAKGGAASKSIHFNLATSSKRASDNVEDLFLPTKSMKSQTIPPIGTPAATSTDSDTKFNILNVLDQKVVNSEYFLSRRFLHQSQSDKVQGTSDPVTGISLEHGKHAASNVAHDESLCSTANQLNFSFIGQKIQFGVVTSTAIVPSTQATSNGIWPPGSVISNASNVQNLSQSNLIDQEKCTDVSCVHLDDTEVEAEAAASAVAFSAISNDEMIVSALDTGSASASEIKSSNASHIFVLPTGASSNRDATNQSAGEESLSVTLPADLSVDAALSSWPSLASPQSSHPMISHIPGLQPSHFPLFDPNPMLGGPIFAFRPQDESPGTLATQQQQSATFGSGQTGPWPPRHSGIESFYGSPAGFPAPYINPAGGITSVHGHSQMVFYNPFAPVGQFGQVGLSYMGSAYIPNGKQPEWKHNPGNSLINVSKVESDSLNAISNHQNAPNMPASIQHLAPGSAVMPVASPFALLNIRPFQSSTDIAVPAHWQSIPHPHLSPHSVPLSRAPEFHQQDTRPSLFSQTPSFDMSNTKFGLLDIDSSATKLPDEINLMESTAPSSASLKINQSSINPQIIDRNKGPIHSVVEGSSSPHFQVPPQDSNFTEKSNHPSGTFLRVGSASEWRRRNVFHGRHSSFSTDKSVASSKMKQIYVAKSLSTGPATSS
ncbi:hypothetical protein AXF42_Ash011907 [Apostasia shenzhenica]|uniref:Uncharacterized protein n=1 Tax=Apostasia shenzhenica TaxID=1088818 RepID=A0A2I0AW58_9ASPA|nr:hypothetical protein AXF42_Ash011907 [Apostasia shenzhenica]